MTLHNSSFIVEPVQRARFKTFIGVDLGGGKGRNTAVAVLRLDPRRDDGVEVHRYGSDDGEAWYDARLVAFLRQHAEDAVVAIDAPLSLTACVRCQVPACPGLEACVDPTVVWFRERARSSLSASGKDRSSIPGYDPAKHRKPLYTPYTQRATEVFLHDEEGILPRETLGQGMGPLTARAAHLTRALAPLYTLNEELIEVYPKATIWKLFGEQTARTYKRHHSEQAVRLQAILERLPGLSFAPGQWREFGLQNDHLFDALICAYTAYLWARDGWQMPELDRAVYARDGWIWIPPGNPPPVDSTRPGSPTRLG